MESATPPSVVLPSASRHCSSAIAAEEAADVIVVGSRARRWPGRGIESRLAEQLESETRVPVLIAPPAGGRRRKAAVANPAR